MKGISDFSKVNGNYIYINEINNFLSINQKRIRYSFFYPKSFLVHKENIYVSDSYNNLIKVFDLKGNFLDEFGKAELSEPYGISAYQDEIYVISRNDGNIYIYNESGNFKNKIVTDMKFPSFLKIKNKNIYVSNTNNHTIDVYNINGDKLYDINLNLKYPGGIEVTENHIFVADQYNKRVVKISKGGIFIKEELTGEYYSNLQVRGKKLIAYDEKNGVFKETIIDDSKIDIEKFLIEKDRLEELGYYYIKENKLNLAKEILKDSDLWDKTYKEENIKLSKDIEDEEFFEFLLRHYNNKELYLNKLKDIKKRNKYRFILKNKIGNFKNLRLHRPKALYIEKDEIWISMFKAKVLIKLDINHKLKEVYEIKNQIDKFIVTNRDIIIIDYYYRELVMLDRMDLNKQKKVYKEIKNPVDIIRVRNEIIILDSVLNKVFIYKLRGRKQKEYKIESKEAVAIYYRDDIYYILDKKLGEIIKYNNFFELIDKINLKDINSPDDIVVDQKGNMYVTDEGNDRVIKLDKNGNIIFEEDSFLKPRDIRLNGSDIYISDFGNDIVKHYNLGGT